MTNEGLQAHVGNATSSATSPSSTDDPTPIDDQSSSQTAHAHISISPQQIAEIQARLPPAQILWPDGTIRDRKSGMVVANLAFTGDVTPENCHHADIDILPGAEQDDHGNVYFQGHLVYQMTATGLIAATPGSIPPTPTSYSSPTLFSDNHPQTSTAVPPPSATPHLPSSTSQLNSVATPVASIPEFVSCWSFCPVTSESSFFTLCVCVWTNGL
jgi:hypothetical protein